MARRRGKESRWNPDPLWSPTTLAWVRLLTVWCQRGLTGVSAVLHVGEEWWQKLGQLKCQPITGDKDVPESWWKHESVNYQNVVSIYLLWISYLMRVLKSAIPLFCIKSREYKITITKFKKKIPKVQNCLKYKKRKFKIVRVASNDITWKLIPHV